MASSLGWAITPWRDVDELIKVRDLLYPMREKKEVGEELNDQRTEDEIKLDRRKLKYLGVRMVYTWEMRGNLPHAVLSTAKLIDAIISAEILQSSEPKDDRELPPRPTPSALRAMLAMSISQFVTGFCDSPPSTVTLGRRSMYEVASEIDMPQGWVEIRHEITHGKMPVTSVLRNCAKESIEWLWEHYWKVIAGSRRTIEDVEGEDDTMIELVSGLLPAKMEDVKGGKHGRGNSVIMQIIARVSTAKDSRRIARILVQKGILIPKRKITEESMSTAFRFWDTDLQRIALEKPSFLTFLLSEFQTILCNESTLEPNTDGGKRAIYLWMDHLLTAKIWSTQRKAVDMKTTSEELMESCLLSPAMWTHRVCKLLLEIGDDSFRRDWTSQYHASVGGEDLDGDDEMLEVSENKVTSPSQLLQKPQRCNWQLYEGVWTPRPIGQL